MLQRHFVNAYVESSVTLYFISALLLVVGKCLIHHMSKLHMYSAYSLHYITLGLVTIFLAFSRFGITVSGDGAEVQSM